MHLHLVDHDAVEPRVERSLAAEAADPPQDRDERVVCQVFCVGKVSRHAQRYGVDDPAVTTVNLPESQRITFRSDRASSASLRFDFSSLTIDLASISKRLSNVESRKSL